jgi:hypothetical protein
MLHYSGCKGLWVTEARQSLSCGPFGGHSCVSVKVTEATLTTVSSSRRRDSSLCSWCIEGSDRANQGARLPVANYSASAPTRSPIPTSTSVSSNTAVMRNLPPVASIKRASVAR